MITGHYSLSSWDNFCRSMFSSFIIHMIALAKNNSSRVVERCIPISVALWRSCSWIIFRAKFSSNATQASLKLSICSVSRSLPPIFKPLGVKNMDSPIGSIGILSIKAVIRAVLSSSVRLDFFNWLITFLVAGCSI